jgi:hypothetical protein
MVVLYGIEIKQEDGSWELEKFDCGTPFRWDDKEQCEQSARWARPEWHKAKEIIEKALEGSVEKGSAKWINSVHWSSNKILDLLCEYGEPSWRVIELERNEDLHSTPFGHAVTRLEGDVFEGSWVCIKSPTNKCHFNVVKDSACDHCLYCGGPEERL